MPPILLSNTMSYDEPPRRHGLRAYTGSLEVVGSIPTSSTTSQ